LPTFIAGKNILHIFYELKVSRVPRSESMVPRSESRVPE